MLAVMLNSAEPDVPREFEDDDLRHACKLASDIYSYYALMFFQEPSGDEKEIAEWAKHSDLALPVFLDYFNRPRIMGTHQQAYRIIERNFVPFDRDLERLVGISATDALSMVQWIGKHLQEKLDEAPKALQALTKVQQEFLTIADSDGFDAAKTFMKENTAAHTPILGAALDSLNTQMVINKIDLETTFGHDMTESFWNLAVAVRGHENKIMYPTDANVAESKALFQFEPNQAFCPILNSVTSGIAQVFDSALKCDMVNQRYLSNRDRALETEGKLQLLKLYDKAPIIFEQAFDEPDSRFEHDLIVVDGDTLLIVEAKASRMREPLRDPTKTYRRMRDSFRGDGGIQKAFDQACRIRRRIHGGEDVPLYSSKGRQVGLLAADTIHRAYVICLTAERFGYMATDLSFLEKRSDEPYPWAVNILDLELFVEGIRFRGWGPAEFYRYLNERAELHGIAKTEDELAIAGAFLQNGDLQRLRRSNSMVMVANDFAGIFDEIWRSKIDGSEVTFKPGLVTTDLRRVIGIDGAKMPPQWPLERRCFCKSGRKYKNCCFKAGRLPPNTA